MSRVLPILFNTEMVRAIMDGRKTTTRRIIKPNKIAEVLDSPARKENADIEDKKFIECLVNAPTKKGDILYVREAYCPNYFDREIIRIASLPGNVNAYRADYHKESIGDVVPEPKWTPSIHMPKKAARIWLKVTDVRAERLQDINAEQAEKEGTGILFLEDVAFGADKYPGIIEAGYEGCIKTQYAYLWDSTIEKRKMDIYDWEANPWVWVIEFERCEKPYEKV